MFNRWLSTTEDDQDIMRELPAVRPGEDILPGLSFWACGAKASHIFTTKNNSVFGYIVRVNINNLVRLIIL